MTAIRGAAAVTGAASGIGRALALELAARGCDLALADRDEAGLQAVAAEIAQGRPRKVTCIASMSASPRRSRPSREADRRPSRPQHPHQQCRRGAARPVQRDRPGADGLADEHQFLGRGARHPRLPAASGADSARRTSSTSPRSSASSRRPARPPMRRRNSRCAASPKACAMSLRWRTARCGCRWCIPAASPPTSPATPAPAVGITDNARRAQIDRAVRDARRRPRRPPRRCASSRASRRTSRAS